MSAHGGAIAAVELLLCFDPKATATQSAVEDLASVTRAACNSAHAMAQELRSLLHVYCTPPSPNVKSASDLALYGGRSRDRTCDHLLVRQVLYR